jgi:hypothetical protein
MGYVLYPISGRLPGVVRRMAKLSHHVLWDA